MSADRSATTATPETASSGPVRREHRHDIDLLRVVCAGFVILLHVAGDYVTGVDADPANGAAVYWTGIVANSMSRFAVPLFFAMAGWAVLFGAPPRAGRRLGGRMVRVVVPLFVWTALYLAWDRVREVNEKSTLELAGESLLGSIRPAYHLWYLYAYVPVVLFLGFVVLLRAGKRPWGVAAALLGLAVAGAQVTAVEQVTGWEWPVVEWNFGLFHVLYAAGGALVLTLDGVKTPRWVWAAASLTALGALSWFQHAVHYVIPNANPLTVVFSFAVALTF
ncbi:MAG TPA: acyltransferase family protein, partial [Phytomonospora sp.]